jgi:cryptochrome
MVKSNNKKSDDKETTTTASYPVGIHWFRNGLRLHDNPCLLEATKSCQTLLPLVIIDPDAPFAQTQGVRAGCIRAQFILESCQELNTKLLKTSMDETQLVVIRGTPAVILPQLVQFLGATALYYEREAAAPIREADAKVLEAIRQQETSIAAGKEESTLFQIHGFDTHTLHPVEHYLQKCKGGSAPSTYGVFTKIFESMTVPKEVETVSKLPKLPANCMEKIQETFKHQDIGIPSLQDLGYDEKDLKHRKRAGIDFDGGEDAGLKILEQVMQRTQWVATFEKPKTSPNALKVDTTGLSPCT